jgi:hypothetical protein
MLGTRQTDPLSCAWRGDRVAARLRAHAPPPRLLFALLWAGGAGTGLLIPRVFAQVSGDSALGVTAIGTCPDSASVQSVLATLLPSIASNAGTSAAGSSASPFSAAGPIAIVDRGDSYVVAVGDRSKTYPDTTHDCAERARVAAAFIALVLAPPPPAPTATASPPPIDAGPPEPTVPPPILPPPPPPTRAQWLALDLHGVAVLSSPESFVMGGAALGVGVASGAWGAKAQCGWLTGDIGGPHSSETIRLERIPCALGPTFRLTPSHSIFGLEFEAGLAAGSVRASGQGFATNLQPTRFEAGAQAAAAIALHGISRGDVFFPLFGFEVTYYPMVYDLKASPYGAVSQTPGFWAGLTLGAGWWVE